MHTEAEQYLKKKDKILGSIIKEVGACKLNHNTRDRFDVLASSIVSQQLSAKAAKTIKGRILDHIGERAKLKASSLANSKVNNLRKAGLSNAKASYIINLAKNTVSGKLDLSHLDKESDEYILKLLTSQKGVGIWTAEMFMIFALGKSDILSTGDAGLIRATQLVYKFKEKPTVAEFTEIAEKWRPYRSIASWYLWRAIDK